MSRKSQQFDVLLVGEQTAHVARQAAGLQERGLALAALNCPQLRMHMDTEWSLDLPDFECRRPLFPARYRFPFLQRLEQTVFHRRLLSVMDKIDPQVVHLNFVAADKHFLTELTPRRSNLVVTVWGTDIHTIAALVSADVRRDIVDLLEHAAVITADSPYMLKCTRELLGRPADDRLRLVYFGIPVQHFADPSMDVGAWTDRLDIGDFSPIVLAPRRIHERYDPQRVLHGFARSRAAKTGVLIFKLFPEDTDAQRAQRRMLEELAEKLGIAGRVRFAPPCTYRELAVLYRMADVACFLLDRDGMPSTAMELWAAETPLVTSNIEHYQDLLIHEHNALLVPPQDPQAVADAIDWVVDNPEGAQQLVQNGKDWVLHNCTDKAMIDGFVQAYHDAGLRIGARAQP